MSEREREIHLDRENYRWQMWFNLKEKAMAFGFIACTSTRNIVCLRTLVLCLRRPFIAWVWGAVDADALAESIARDQAQGRNQ